MRVGPAYSAFFTCLFVRAVRLLLAVSEKCPSPGTIRAGRVLAFRRLLSARVMVPVWSPALICRLGIWSQVLFWPSVPALSSSIPVLSSPVVVPGLGPPLLPSLFPVQMKRPQVTLPAAVYRNMVLIRIFFCCSRRGCIRHRRGCRRIRRRCHARFWDGLRLRRSSCLRNRCRSGRR